MTDTTHAPGCWSWGPRHYGCALREIQALRAEVEVWKASLRELEERAQRDGALLRLALKAMEHGAWDALFGRNAAAANRERLEKGVEQKA